MELWNGYKPSCVIIVYRVSITLAKEEIGKLGSRTEVSLFVGYPKGTRGGIFYSLKKIKYSCRCKLLNFLENDYMNNFKL